MLDGNVIVKSVRGISKAPLLTQPLSPQHLNAEALRLSPAIFQERVSGNHHLRVHCFGKKILAVRIDSESLDWRGNVNVPFVSYEVPDDLRVLILDVLRRLNLKMGIMDLKLDEHGTPVWLEINQQGQFLFVEGISGLKLASAFAEFLYDEASQNGRSSGSSDATTDTVID